MSNPLHFWKATTPKKKNSTKMTTPDQQSSSKDTEKQAVCQNRRKEWKGTVHSADKSVDKTLDLDLSMISDNEFDCTNRSDGNLVHSNSDDELQLHPKRRSLPLKQV